MFPSTRAPAQLSKDPFAEQYGAIIQRQFAAIVDRVPAMDMGQCLIYQ